MPTALITGAAGGVGTVLRRGLAERGWQLRLFDRAPVPEAPDAVVADLRDTARLDAAMAGVQAVVHLAGIPVEAPFADILESNIDGTYRVFDAALRSGVRRVVYASSNHVAGYAPADSAVSVEAPPRPDTYYGVSKVFGEALGRLYHERFGMDVICVRIGSCTERPTTRRHLALWLSPADAVDLFHACLTAPSPGFVVTFGVSANTRGRLDIGPALELGYRPRDDAERYADDVPGPEQPAPGDPFLGGGFTQTPLGEWM